MTIPTVDSQTSGAAASGSSSSPSTSSAEVSQLSNPQLFLKLLIAELQNQNPTNPMDPSAILQQTSELSNVEAMNSMTGQMSDVQATGLLGHTVTVKSGGAGGTPLVGTVSAINLSATGQPTLTVSGASAPVSLSDITQVA
ncbi:MAG TPA: flagellar hook capping FlgD N-terminal domain-containing protein [Acidimicrobiales bacterium]|nr:flagellar hook capping FlgD N-terminal domain-containing protein [Acidimicrobiales bacterium]